MKKLLSVILALIMCLSLLPMTALAAGDTLKDIPIPKPAAPNYFMTDVEYENWNGNIRMITLFDNSMLELTREHDIDAEAFYAKYGIENEGYYWFSIEMQYDVNVDGKGWQYKPAWDEEYGYDGYYDSGYTDNVLHDDLISEFTLADLYHEKTRELYGDMVYLSHQNEYGDDVWRFDLTNHSAQVRCRYFMEYMNNDECVIRTSEWSDIAVVGKGSTQRIPAEPTGYAAPIISNMRVVPPENSAGEAYVYFEMDTPDSIWDAQIYYIMNGDSWGIDELQAQICVNGGQWQEVYVSNAGWALYEGDRVTSTTAALTAESNVKLRVRYGGPLGYSDWSDVLEVNSGTYPDCPFVDVYVKDFFYDPVLWAVENGITTGTSETTFEPYADCTRGQVVTFLWRAAGSPAPTTQYNPFVDVEPGAYYYDAVLWAVEKGITNGISATTFEPHTSCNRAQIVTFLWRAAGSRKPINVNNPFTDVELGSFYYEAVLWAVREGITTGTSDTTFSPASICARGQIVTFLYRAMKD